MTLTAWQTPTKRSLIIGGNSVIGPIGPIGQYVQTSTITAIPKHWDQGAHRRRQDHDYRARPLLYGRLVQDRRGPRRHRRHGLDGAGAGARHYHHVSGDHVLLATRRRGLSNQYH